MATYSRKRSAPQEFDAPSAPARVPLSVRSNNANQSRRPFLLHSVKAKKQRLTQLTIDLGGDPHRRCKACSMEYIPSNPEDALLHKQYHNSSMAGVDLPKGSLEKANVVYECGRKISKVSTASTSKQSRNGLDRIVRVDGRDTLSVRRFARKALQIAEKDLGAVEISDDSLWSQVSVTRPNNNKSETEVKAGGVKARSLVQPNSKADRYKVFLYVQDSKCVGLCLVERIEEARKVLPRSTGNSSAIITDTDIHKAKLGISRIWVSRDMRNLGIARDLIDTARLHFSSGVTVDKELIAWSQPTESGANLARSWFGKENGWLVYDEQHVALLRVENVRSDARKARQG